MVPLKPNICDNCGCTVPPGELFYRCRTEIVSGFDGYLAEPVEKDGDELIRDALREMAGRSPDDLLADVHEEITFILCPRCRAHLSKMLHSMKKQKGKKGRILLFPPAGE